MAERLLCLGRITAAHGIKGEVRVKSYTAAPEDLVAYGPLSDASGAKQYRLSLSGRLKSSLICRIDGVKDRNAAEALRGLALYVPRTALPEIEETDLFYYTDLEGLRVQDSAGQPLGRVKAVADHGAGAFLLVAFEDGQEQPFSFTREIVPEVNLEAGYLVLVPPRTQLSQDGEGQSH